MHRDHTSFSAKWSLDNFMLGCLHQPRIVHQRVLRWHTDRSIPPRYDAIFLSLLPLVAATLYLGQEVTEGKPHSALAMTIDILAIDLRGRTMAEDAFQHGRHFRGVTS